MTTNELLACLVDRPCSACKFHTEQGCSKWTCVFEDKIEELPSAERVGKWIDGCQYGMSGTYWYRYCSECGYIREDDDIDKDPNYCPNCGAKMKGEE